jgi:hypothetical protein
VVELKARKNARGQGTEDVRGRDWAIKKWAMKI